MFNMDLSIHGIWFEWSHPISTTNISIFQFICHQRAHRSKTLLQLNASRPNNHNAGLQYRAKYDCSYFFYIAESSRCIKTVIKFRLSDTGKFYPPTIYQTINKLHQWHCFGTTFKGGAVFDLKRDSLRGHLVQSRGLSYVFLLLLLNPLDCLNSLIITRGINEKWQGP